MRSGEAIGSEKMVEGGEDEGRGIKDEEKLVGGIEKT